MMKPRFACQTISWGNNQKEHLPRVFAEIASAGFDGVEVGFRHIADTPPVELQRMLKAEGLTLVASHVGGNLEDTGQAGGERDMLDTVLDYLDELGVRRLMYSGLNAEDPDELIVEVGKLRRGVERATERGIDLLYHNHNWEFQNGGRIIEALYAEDTIGFCPDVGWIHKAGEDIAATLERMGDRIGAVHFKDFASMGDQVDAVCLGTGVVPLKEAAGWVEKNLAGDVWVIAEQDSTDGPTADMARTNIDFLRTAFQA